MVDSQTPSSNSKNSSENISAGESGFSNKESASEPPRGSRLQLSIKHKLVFLLLFIVFGSVIGNTGCYDHGSSREVTCGG